MGVLKAKVAGAWVPISQGWSPLAGGLVGHQRTVSAVNGIGATAVDLGASVTWTADPSRTYKTTVVTGRIDQLTANAYFSVDITDASNGIKQSHSASVVFNSYDGITTALVETGLSGSTTRKARGRTSAGTANVQAGTFVLVEDITAVSPGGTQPPYALWETAAYTPTLTNWAVGGAGTLSARWLWIGGPNSGDWGTLSLSGQATLGTGFSVAGPMLISIPTSLFTHQMSWAITPVGWAYLESSIAAVRIHNASAINLIPAKVDGTYMTYANVTASIPHAWASGNNVWWYCDMMARRV